MGNVTGEALNAFFGCIKYYHDFRISPVLMRSSRWPLNLWRAVRRLAETINCLADRQSTLRFSRSPPG